MLFNSYDYLFFLPLVVIATWALPPRFRPVWLVAASYYFYAFWNPPFLLLIFALTLVNYLIGMAQGKRAKRSRSLVLASVVISLGALAFFKYLGFMDDTVNRVAHFFGLPASLPVVQLILPLGLSFFTFEFVHYQVDLYRGYKPITNPIRFALFPAFFPTQIAGPIKRYQDFNRQVESFPRFNAAMFMEGLELIALGLVKKVLFADTLMTPITALVHANVGVASGADAWLSVLAFYLQIYMDFSGYTDIGRGSAQLLGYRVPLNFRSPQLATSVREFWHRWHMSLAFWLRDYVFTVIGRALRGQQRRRAKVWETPLNIIITFTLGGLWHGAAWNFVLWGMSVGGAYDIEQQISSRTKNLTPPKWIAVIAGWVTTQLTMMMLVQIFRSSDFNSLLGLWNKMVTGGFHTHLLSSFQVFEVIVIFGGLMVAQALLTKLHPRELLARANWGVEVVLRPAYALSLLAVFTYSYSVLGASERFYYFQF
jgi:alginate O-acetyltransferase complex protein AlgI